MFALRNLFHVPLTNILHTSLLVYSLFDLRCCDLRVYNFVCNSNAYKCEVVKTSNFDEYFWPDGKPEGPLFSTESVRVSLTGTSTLQR